MAYAVWPGRTVTSARMAGLMADRGWLNVLPPFLFKRTVRLGLRVRLRGGRGGRAAGCSKDRLASRPAVCCAEAIVRSISRSSSPADRAALARLSKVAVSPASAARHDAQNSP